MNKIIEIVISPTGEARVETKGFSGTSCRDASKFIEQSLGQAAGEQLTVEFFSRAAHPQLAEHEQRG